MKVRADQRLVSAGLVADLHEARSTILLGRVFLRLPSGSERRVEKAGEPLAENAELRVEGAALPFVSRGGIKLARALEAFGVDPRGRVCADIGASTGGFTDCLLQRGAARVHAVDVGYGLIAWKLRQDPRVHLHERTNARHLTEAVLGERVSLMVADVSFMGLSQLLPALVPLLLEGGALITLVKPQFELPRGRVEVGGIVRDPAAQKEAVAMVRRAAEALGLTVVDEIESPIRGADGNLELLLLLRVPE